MLMPSKLAILTILLVVIVCVSNSLGCNRVPTAPHGAKRSGDNGYRIAIGDNPMGYQPGKIYNVFLVGAHTHNNIQSFSQFTINARAASNNDKKTATFSMANPKRVGRFQLFDDALTEFNMDCVNTISQADDIRKSEVQVMWVAPASGSGCVALSAMVYENPNSWFADDGNLTKILCEGAPETNNPIDECCACDEAKYNFIFEGIWSNETHPRDFPFAAWLTHFSDVIGASHETNFSFWGENHLATDGFRSLAEWGSIRLMETELRAKGSRLKTLVKAAGLWYPNVNTNTSANFRVDQKHPKLSLASMFGPSPDWVVGISGLNLCQADCTWKDSLDIDLYPWDAGTDHGITYMSPNSETFPREKMYRITTMFPEDPRQPFYNPKSSEMVPMARLYIRRTKVIPRNCDDQFLQSQVLELSENTEEGETRPECQTTEYTEWTPCSVSCGKGIRMRTRQYNDESLAKSLSCNRQLISKEMCVADIPECDGAQNEDQDPDEDLAKSAANVNDQGEGIGVCRTTPWSEYGPCSTSCGIGVSMRVRTFIEHAGRKKCPHISIVEKEKCMKPECSVDNMEAPDPMCPITQWSDWSPCSKTCGRGVRIRTRLLLVGDESTKMECAKRTKLNEQQECTQRQECVFDREEALEICSSAPDAGPCRGEYSRFAYDQNEGRCVPFVYTGCRGNLNNFLTKEECMQTCQSAATQSQRQSSTPAPIRNLRPTPAYDRRPLTTELPFLFTENGRPVDCVLTDWTEWSACSASCGEGYSAQYRRILVEPKNGGRPCLRRFRRRRCSNPAC